MGLFGLPESNVAFLQQKVADLATVA